MTGIHSIPVRCRRWFSRRLAILLLALPGLAAATPAAAQLLPCEAIELVVPWNAGGATDVMFRIIAERYNAAGHMPRFDIRNVPGERGLTGARLVAKAPADGCTMLAGQDVVTLEHLSGNTDISPEAFAPVARVALTPLILASANRAPFAVPGGIEPAFGKGEAPLLAAGFPGSIEYFVILAFSQAIGVQPEFRSYLSPRRTVRALIDGEILISEVSPAAAAAGARDGSFRLLGITAAHRAPAMPDLPTLREQGIEFVFDVERGIFAPAGTPEALRLAIAANLSDVLAEPEIEKIFTEKLTRPAWLGPAAFEERIEKAAEAWKTVADRAGLTRP
ncbi:MAG: tripartite tricarboxylate transporter substrate-binding protein [Rhodospirillales bacterium]